MGDQTQVSQPGPAAGATGAALVVQRRLLAWLTVGAMALLVASVVGFAWHEQSQELGSAAGLTQRRADRLAGELQQTLEVAGVAIQQIEARLQRLPAGQGLSSNPDEAAGERARLLRALPLALEVHALDGQGRALELAAVDHGLVGTHGHPVPPGAGDARDGRWIAGDPVVEGTPPQRVLPLLRRAEANPHGVAWYSTDLLHSTLVAHFGASRSSEHGGVALFRIEPDGSAITLLARSPSNEAELGRRLQGPLHRALKTGARGVFDDVTQIDGRARIVGYRRLSGPAQDLVVALGTDRSEVLADWRASLPVEAAVTLGMLGLIGFGAWRLDRSLLDTAGSIEALHDSEAQFRALADNLPDTLVRLDRAGRHLYANPGVERATGLPPAAFLGKTNADLGMPQANVEVWMATLARAFDTGRAEHLEFSYPGPLGLRDWESMVVAESGHGANPQTALVISRDVTQRRQAERALRRSELRFRLAASFGQVWDWDIAAQRVEFPQTFWTALGHEAPPEQDAVAAFESILHPDDRPRWRQALRDHLVRRTPYALQYRAHDAAGHVHWFQTQGQALWDDAGRATYMAGTTFDITERHQLEEAVRASEVRQRHLLASSPAVIYTARPEGDFAATYYSDNLEALLGYRAHEFTSDPGFWLAHVHPDDADAMLAQLDRVFSDGHVALEYRFRHRDGRWRWMHDEVRLTRDDSGKPVELIGSWTDITARREAEDEVRRLNAGLEQRVRERTAELAHSEARLRALFDTAPMAIGEEDWSQVQRMLRDLRTQGTTDGPAYFAAHPEFVRACMRGVRLLRMNRQMLQLHGARSQAEELPDLEAVYGSPDNLPQFVGELEALWAGQRLYSSKKLLPSVTGRLLSLMLTMSLPAPDDDDGLALVCLVDITEIDRLNAELDQSLARLTRINRELQTFTYSVSHDLKAPLRGIDGYSQLLLRDHAGRLDDEARSFLAQIRQATQQMGQLIDDLLAYSRMERRSLELAPLALGDAVQDVLATYADELRRRGVQLRLGLAAGLRVQGDGQSLSMALRNLVDNALKFSRDAQPPAIEIGAEASGRDVTLWVRDNGVGFDMKFHDRIFDIFQRLHRAEDYPGTGLGLAIVRTAMERMGGRVWAESRPGRGATFFLQLPTSS